MASHLSGTHAGYERLVITPRDIDILRATQQHRYVRTDHLKRLLFSESSERSAQMRLRKLWRHGYLHRLQLASVVDGQRSPTRGPGISVFTLAAKGAAVLHGERGSPAPADTAPSAATVQHELVVTDFMVALQEAIRNRADLWLIETSHAGHLWQRLNKRAPSPGRLVPDGAVTIQRADRTRETYYLEVVRAGIRAGNGTLWDKLLRYAEANHRGAFREQYGHERLRGVLIATTTPERAEHLRTLAKSLPHGRRLFAFAAYQSQRTDGQAASSFTPEDILRMPWKTADDDVLRLGVDTPSAAPAV